MSTYVYCGFTLNSQSVTNNTSNVTFWVDVQMTGNSYNLNGMPSYRTFSGEISGSASWTSTCGYGTRKRVRTETLTVKHEDDGTAYIHAKVRIVTQISAGTIIKECSLTLPTIARASQPSTSGTTAMGSAMTIKTNRASTSFTHTIKYTFGSASGTIGTGIGASKSWTIPLSLANQVPNGTSGTGTITCITYKGSTKIGTKTVKFTATVPSSVKPTLSSCNVSMVNENSVVAGWGVYVAGYSKARITASAAGVYNSIIKSFTISGGYSTTQSVSTASLNYTGGYLTAGTKSFTVTAKDSRNRVSSSLTTSSITVYAYSNPTITNLSAVRQVSDPTKVDVTANWSFSSVNGKNSATGRLYYKKTDDSVWSDYGVVQSGSKVTLLNIDETSGYMLRVTVTDSLSNTSVRETDISTRQVLLDFGVGGKSLGIGKIVEVDNGVECSLPFYFLDEIYIDGVTLDQYIQNKVKEITGS